MENSQKITVYTVGHSNQSIDQFVHLLSRHDMELVVDVRSAPYSRYVPHFSKEPLEQVLPHRGIAYHYLGDKLGGKPGDDTDSDGGRNSKYIRIRRSETFKQGLEELVEMASQRRLAIMCAEEDPLKCHRNLLVGDALRERAVRVIHIRKDGLDRGNTSLAEFF